MADFRVHNQGSVVGFTPVSGAARAFIEDEVASEPWQWLGSTLWVDWRAAQGLVDFIGENGFSIK